MTQSNSSTPLSYKDAGVDIDAGDALVERIKPERDQNNRTTYRDNWWLFGEPRRDLRPALAGLRRYIATGLDGFFTDDPALGRLPTGVIQASDGHLYGIAAQGGVNNAGLVYRCC